MNQYCKYCGTPIIEEKKSTATGGVVVGEDAAERKEEQSDKFKGMQIDDIIEFIEKGKSPVKKQAAVVV